MRASMEASSGRKKDFHLRSEIHWQRRSVDTDMQKHGSNRIDRKRCSSARRQDAEVEPFHETLELLSKQLDSQARRETDSWLEEGKVESSRFSSKSLPYCRKELSIDLALDQSTNDSIRMESAVDDCYSIDGADMSSDDIYYPSQDNDMDANSSDSCDGGTTSPEAQSNKNNDDIASGLDKNHINLDQEYLRLLTQHRPPASESNTTQHRFHYHHVQNPKNIHADSDDVSSDSDSSSSDSVSETPSHEALQAALTKAQVANTKERREAEKSRVLSAAADLRQRQLEQKQQEDVRLQRKQHLAQLSKHIRLRNKAVYASKKSTSGKTGGGKHGQTKSNDDMPLPSRKPPVPRLSTLGLSKKRKQRKKQSKDDHDEAREDHHLGDSSYMTDLSLKNDDSKRVNDGTSPHVPTSKQEHTTSDIRSLKRAIVKRKKKEEYNEQDELQKKKLSKEAQKRRELAREYMNFQKRSRLMEKKRHEERKREEEKKRLEKLRQLEEERRESLRRAKKRSRLRIMNKENTHLNSQRALSSKAKRTRTVVQTHSDVSDAESECSDKSQDKRVPVVLTENQEVEADDTEDEYSPTFPVSKSPSPSTQEGFKPDMTEFVVEDECKEAPTSEHLKKLYALEELTQQISSRLNSLMERKTEKRSSEEIALSPESLETTSGVHAADESDDTRVDMDDADEQSDEEYSRNVASANESEDDGRAAFRLSLSSSVESRTSLQDDKLSEGSDDDSLDFDQNKPVSLYDFMKPRPKGLIFRANILPRDEDQVFTPEDSSARLRELLLAQDDSLSLIRNEVEKERKKREQEQQEELRQRSNEAEARMKMQREDWASSMHEAAATHLISSDMLSLDIDDDTEERPPLIDTFVRYEDIIRELNEEKKEEVDADADDASSEGSEKYNCQDHVQYHDAFDEDDVLEESEVMDRDSSEWNESWDVNLNASQNGLSLDYSPQELAARLMAESELSEAVDDALNHLSIVEHSRALEGALVASVQVAGSYKEAMEAHFSDYQKALDRTAFGSDVEYSSDRFEVVEDEADETFYDAVDKSSHGDSHTQLHFETSDGNELGLSQQRSEYYGEDEFEEDSQSHVNIASEEVQSSVSYDTEKDEDASNVDVYDESAFEEETQDEPSSLPSALKEIVVQDTVVEEIDDEITESDADIDTYAASGFEEETQQSVIVSEATGDEHSVPSVAEEDSEIEQVDKSIASYIEYGDSGFEEETQQSVVVEEVDLDDHSVPSFTEEVPQADETNDSVPSYNDYDGSGFEEESGIQSAQEGVVSNEIVSEEREVTSDIENASDDVDVKDDQIQSTSIVEEHEVKRNSPSEASDSIQDIEDEVQSDTSNPEEASIAPSVSAAYEDDFEGTFVSGSNINVSNLVSDPSIEIEDNLEFEPEESKVEEVDEVLSEHKPSTTGGSDAYDDQAYDDSASFEEDTFKSRDSSDHNMPDKSESSRSNDVELTPYIKPPTPLHSKKLDNTTKSETQPHDVDDFSSAFMRNLELRKQSEESLICLRLRALERKQSVDVQQIDQAVRQAQGRHRPSLETKNQVRHLMLKKQSIEALFVSERAKLESQRAACIAQYYQDLLAFQSLDTGFEYQEKESDMNMQPASADYRWHDQKEEEARTPEVDAYDDESFNTTSQVAASRSNSGNKEISHEEQEEAGYEENEENEENEEDEEDEENIKPSSVNSTDLELFNEEESEMAENIIDEDMKSTDQKEESDVEEEYSENYDDTYGDEFASVSASQHSKESSDADDVKQSEVQEDDVQDEVEDGQASIHSVEADEIDEVDPIHANDEDNTNADGEVVEQSVVSEENAPSENEQMDESSMPDGEYTEDFASAGHSVIDSKSRMEEIEDVSGNEPSEISSSNGEIEEIDEDNKYAGDSFQVDAGETEEIEDANTYEDTFQAEDAETEGVETELRSEAGNTMVEVHTSISDDSSTTKLLLDEINTLRKNLETRDNADDSSLASKIAQKRERATELLAAKVQLLEQEQAKFSLEEERRQVNELAHMALGMNVEEELVLAKAAIERRVADEMHLVRTQYPVLNKELHIASGYGNTMEDAETHLSNDQQGDEYEYDEDQGDRNAEEGYSYSLDEFEGDEASSSAVVDEHAVEEVGKEAVDVQSGDDEVESDVSYGSEKEEDEVEDEVTYGDDDIQAESIDDNATIAEDEETYDRNDVAQSEAIDEDSAIGTDPDVAAETHTSSIKDGASQSADAYEDDYDDETSTDAERTLPNEATEATEETAQSTSEANDYSQSFEVDESIKQDKPLILLPVTEAHSVEEGEEEEADESDDPSLVKIESALVDVHEKLQEHSTSIPVKTSINMMQSHDSGRIEGSQSEVLSKSIEEQMKRLDQLKAQIDARKEEVLEVQHRLRVEEQKGKLSADEVALWEQTKEVEAHLRRKEAELDLIRRRNRMEASWLRQKQVEYEKRVQRGYEDDLLQSFEYVEQVEMAIVATQSEVVEEETKSDLLNTFDYVEDVGAVVAGQGNTLRDTPLLERVCENDEADMCDPGVEEDGVLNERLNTGEEDNLLIKPASVVQTRIDLLNGYDYVENVVVAVGSVEKYTRELVVESSTTSDVFVELETSEVNDKDDLISSAAKDLDTGMQMEIYNQNREDHKQERIQVENETDWLEVQTSSKRVVAEADVERTTDIIFSDLLSMVLQDMTDVYNDTKLKRQYAAVEAAEFSPDAKENLDVPLQKEMKDLDNCNKLEEAKLEQDQSANVAPTDNEKDGDLTSEAVDDGQTHQTQHDVAKSYFGEENETVTSESLLEDKVTPPEEYSIEEVDEEVEEVDEYEGMTQDQNESTHDEDNASSDPQNTPSQPTEAVVESVLFQLYDEMLEGSLQWVTDIHAKRSKSVAPTPAAILEADRLDEESDISTLHETPQLPTTPSEAEQVEALVQSISISADKIELSKLPQASLDQVQQIWQSTVQTIAEQCLAKESISGIIPPGDLLKRVRQSTLSRVQCALELGSRMQDYADVKVRRVQYAECAPADQAEKLRDLVQSRARVDVGHLVTYTQRQALLVNSSSNLPVQSPSIITSPRSSRRNDGLVSLLLRQEGGELQEQICKDIFMDIMESCL